MESEKQKFYSDIPFVKSVTDEKGTLGLLGYASTWVEDRDGECVDPLAFDGTLDTYLGKNPILLWQHNMDWPIGTVKSMEVDESGLRAEAYVPPPAPGEPDWAHLAYNKIKRGIVKTFSIGGFFERDNQKGKPIIKRVHLLELSVVSIPSNPDSIFEAAVKALKGPHRPELTQKHISQMAQLIGLRTLSDPELVTMADAERQERYDILAAAYRESGKRPPSYDAWRNLAAGILTKKGREVVPDSRHVVEVARLTYGYVTEEKRGRVLSGKNENELRAAHDDLVRSQERIGTVLSQLEKERIQEGSGEANEVEATT